MSTPSSLITALHSYCPPPCRTTPFHTTPSSSRPHPSSTSTSANLLGALFSPAMWDRFFVISPQPPILRIEVPPETGRQSYLSQLLRSFTPCHTSEAQAPLFTTILSYNILKPLTSNTFYHNLQLSFALSDNTLP